MGRLPRFNQCTSADKQSYDKIKGGPFQLVWTENNLKQVGHVSGATADIPAHIVVDLEWALVSWFSDMGAKNQRQPAKFIMKDFFPNIGGPHTHVISRAELHNIAAELKAENLRGSTSATSDLPCEVLVASAKQRTDRLADKARETLKRYRRSKAERKPQSSSQVEQPARCPFSARWASDRMPWFDLPPTACGYSQHLSARRPRHPGSDPRFHSPRTTLVAGCASDFGLGRRRA